MPVLMMRLESDLGEYLLASADRSWARCAPRFSADKALKVVMAAEGYPGTPAKGGTIEGLGARQGPGEVFHAGTRAMPRVGSWPRGAACST